MEEAERKALNRRLSRMLRAIFLTSLTAANVCAAHARRAHKGSISVTLTQHAQELRERATEAARLLSHFGYGRPVSRLFLGPLTWFWGHLTAYTGRQFSLHMLGNMEAQGAKLTAYAEKVARELVNVAMVESLVRMGRAENARKRYIISQLELASGADSDAN